MRTFYTNGLQFIIDFVIFIRSLQPTHHISVRKVSTLPALYITYPLFGSFKNFADVYVDTSVSIK